MLGLRKQIRRLAVVGSRGAITMLLAVVILATATVTNAGLIQYTNAGGTWTGTSIAPGIYTALTASPQAANNVYGYNSTSGNVDWIYNHGAGWLQINIPLGKQYTDLKAYPLKINTWDALWGTVSTGGIDLIYNTGANNTTWTTVHLGGIATAYAALALDGRDNGTSSCLMYGAKPGGGIDQINWVTGSTYAATPLAGITGVYTALTNDNAAPKLFYGMNSTTGNFDKIQYVGTAWVVTPLYSLASLTGVALDPKNTVNGYNAFFGGKSGNLDYASAAVGGAYSAAAMAGTGGYNFDPVTGDRVTANVVYSSYDSITPEPASLAVLLLGGLALIRRRRSTLLHGDER